MPGAGETYHRNDQEPFSLPWVNSCYQQTLLPNAPWHKLEGHVAKALAGRVEKQFAHPQRKEMLLELLGRHFVDTYLNHVERNPQVLDASHMSGDEYDRLKVEATSWLNNQMYKAVKDTGMQAVMNGADSESDPLPPEFGEFLQHTFTVFTNGLDRELFRQEEDLKAEKEKELQDPKKRRQQKTNADIFKVPAPSRLKAVSTVGSHSSSSSVPKPTSAQLRGMVHTVQGDPPPLWGHHSDSIGAGVVSLLQRDPRKFDHVAGRLHGRQLPGSLRSYMWADVLLKGERRRMKEVYAEKVVREKFARAVTRGLTELNIKKPTQSPINGLIQNAVIETYSKTVSMIPYKHIDHVTEASRALNVLYVFDRSYEPYLVFWLFPLQIAFRDRDTQAKDHGEHVLELAMYLDLLNSSCFPTWPQVFAVAESVMLRLQDDDPEFHDHLKHIATINVQGSPKEFLIQMLHQEKEKAEELLQTGHTTARSMDHDLSWQLLADPLIFIRRWIGEGFVSVLDTPGVMYVWDQCFMQCWRNSVLQNVCLALLELSRHRFMEARNYIEMKEVFLNEGCKLYTVDIQMAWIHVENGKHIMDIPFLNRQRPSTPGSRMSVAQSVATTTASGPGLLQTFGIKRLQAKLIIPAEMIQRESWLTTLDPAGLKLRCGVYFGSIQLNSRISTLTPSLLSADRDSYGNMVYRFSFAGERYVYGNFDLSQYDVERELGASPFAILSLEYMRPGASSKSPPGMNLLPLGWSRVPLFRGGGGGEGGVSVVEKFVLVEGEAWVALHPGDVPDSLLNTAPPPPSPSSHPTEDAYLGYNSELAALVFDPNNEPRTPPPPPPVDRQVPPTTTQPPKKTPKPTPRKSLQPETINAPTPPTNRSEGPSTNRNRPTPRSEPRPTPQADPHAFVDHDPGAAQNPPPTSNREPFDVYVDAVRYIPDNASIVKVTGRVLKGGEVTGLQDILALPLLSSPARSPEFDFRLTINAGRQKTNPEMLLLLRVYTVDIVTEQLVVVGSCLVKIFDITKKKEGVLRVGGHQLRLRSGMPNVKQGIANLKHTDLDQVPAIPACTVLLRIMPTSQDPVPAPSYSSGYYESSSSQPTESERRIFTSYADHMRYPHTEGDMVQRLQAAEGTSTGTGEAILLEWLQQRLDIKTQLAPSKPAENLSLTRCVRYRLRSGLRLRVNQAFNLPEEKYVVVAAQVSCGGQSSDMTPMEDGSGGNNPVFFTRLQGESYLMAPAFEGNPQSLFPFYDAGSVLVLRLLSFSVAYKPTADNKIPGTLIAASGDQMDVRPDNLLGWTVLPLFDGNSVQAGTHHVPLFRGDIPSSVVKDMKTTAPQEVLGTRTWDSNSKHTAASVSVTIWDGHFDFNELPTVPKYSFMEEAIGDAEACKAARAAAARATGSKVSDLVLDGLPAKVKKQGVKGAVYQKEKGFFDEVADRTFLTLGESAFSQGVIQPM